MTTCPSSSRRGVIAGPPPQGGAPSSSSPIDRESVGEGKRVDLGGRRIVEKKKPECSTCGPGAAVWMAYAVVCECFLFEEEGGVGVDVVTGVQACALPIFPRRDDEGQVVAAAVTLGHDHLPLIIAAGDYRRLTTSGVGPVVLIAN